MESMKQCPQCGKYVAADRTYCMHCGVTLGIRCPDCRAVQPLGVKVCSACGHSFVKKKKALNIPLWKWMKQHARPVVMGLMAVLLLLSLVAAGFPAAELTVTAEEVPIEEHTVTGYELMLYFVGGNPESIDTIMSLRAIADAEPLLRLFLFCGGVGWLALLCGLALAILLTACHMRRFGRRTARRLIPLFGVALGGGALLCGMAPAIGTTLRDALLSANTSELAELSISVMPPWPIIVCAAATVGMLLHALLYMAVFRNEAEVEGEMPLSHILSKPLLAGGRLLRGIFRRLRRRLRRGKATVERDEPALAVTPRFTTFLILLGVSLIFTQALLSKISHIFFWFMLLLPVVMLIYVLIAKHAVSAEMLSSTVTTEKNMPYTYEFRIHNRSILALPFMDAKISIPQSNSVRCTERTVRLSMAPLTAYHMKNTVSFRFRGTYDIGVRCFYIYDFFRLFRARVDIESMATVYVLPRRLSLDDTLAQAISDSTVRTVRSPLAVDKLEVSDIRDYQNGDSLKSIHWKLSSKSETFVVKDYNTGTANQTVVFCDLARHFPDEPPAQKSPESVLPEPPAGSRAARREAAKRARAEAKERQRQQAAARSARRIREDKNTHAISDEDLQKRLNDRAAAARMLGGEEATEVPAAAAEVSAPSEELATLNVHEPAEPAYYEDMNEYLADGVVELSIAMVLAELRQGHEVLLLWFDRRSDTGIYAYPLRGIDEFEHIYHLFATAPLCEPDREDGTSSQDITSLTALTAHLQSIKQLFVIPSLDAPMLTALTSLPGLSDAGNAGCAEVVLYSPEERFKYPRERSSYLEGCREQLAAHGVSLTAGSFNLTRPATAAEGGERREA